MRPITITIFLPYQSQFRQHGRIAAESEDTPENKAEKMAIN